MQTLLKARTFQNELHLPSLTLPKFKDVLHYYLDIISTIIPTSIFFNYKAELDKLFIDNTSIVDEYLKTKIRHDRNFIKNWWLSSHYINKDLPMIPFDCLIGISNLNINNHWSPEISSQIDRAAQYVRALMMLWSCLRQEVVVPDRFERTEAMLSMNNYRYVFNTARLPNQKPKSYFKTFCEGECPSSILVSVNGYVFEVFLIEDEIIWPLERITRVLTDIYKFALLRDSKNNVTPIMIQTKSMFVGSLKFANSKNPFLIDVHKAILWLTFDRTSPNLENIPMALASADCQNRCPIKSLSVSVFANGIVGLYADPAAIDMAILKSVIDFADSHILCAGYNEAKGNDYPLLYKYKSNMRLSTNPWNLYDLDVPSIFESELGGLRRQFNYNAYQLDCSYRIYQWFNSESANNWGVDPQITIHIIILLTFYLMYDDLLPSCAVISHRHFYHGRLEFVPTGFIEVIEFAKAVKLKKCTPRQLKVIFLAAHQKLKKAFDFCHKRCGPCTYLNYLKDNPLICQMSDGLNKVINDDIWEQSGFNNTFYITTHYLGENHTIVIPNVTLQNSIALSYTVSSASTLVTLNCRYNDDYSKSMTSPTIFLKELLTNIELLNQMFS